ncbi:hypothetical protein [Polyangium sorediatum]|uniref:Uncharacterized protein n=1 Tax=Polyangium sorediatum TaxID=889274 RepID=A0ABT6NZB7_9BACT|nr:hypothetical protein [Polyangium sorediatum]MDI1433694.1 hypothetical protein [Polyangium sorediatum]
MRLSNGLRSLVVAFLASGFVACTADVQQGSGQEMGQGALEGDGKENGDGKVSEESPEAPTLPSGCLQGTVESATCEDPGVLKDQAFAICQESGFVFTVFEYQGGDCGWQTTQAHYECCPVPPTPPVDPPPPNEPPPPEPPAICASDSIGDGITCQSRDFFKQAAHDACNQAGLQLFDLVLDGGDCSPAEAVKMTYFCTAGGSVCP